MTSFATLPLAEPIQKAIKTCGYTSPTPVQAKSIPLILAGKDLAASAQTGTGKTAAFVLPALHKLSQLNPSKKPRVLILTPTRELATQITKSVQTYSKFMRCSTANIVGGMPYHLQIKDLARGADIIIATPGRLMDHIEQKRVDLSQIEMLVLDEADRMLDMGFIDDVKFIAKLIPNHRQTLLFSATLDSKLLRIVSQLLKDPVRIDLSQETIAAPQIKQELYKIQHGQNKFSLLKVLLTEKQIFKAIIFSATKINADRLADQLCEEGFAAAALHGDLRQNVRNRTVEKLRRGKIQYLVATDVAARGIDISDITHVINYDLPKFCEDYVHRIGRTGRAGKDGVAISFIAPTDMRNLQRIERFIGQRLKFNHHTTANDATIEQQPTKKHHARTHHFQEETAERRKPSYRQRYERDNTSSYKKSYRRDEASSDDFDDNRPRRFKKSRKAEFNEPYRGRSESNDSPRGRSAEKKFPSKHSSKNKDFSFTDNADSKPGYKKRPRKKFNDGNAANDGFSSRDNFNSRDGFNPRHDKKRVKKKW